MTLVVFETIKVWLLIFHSFLIIDNIVDMLFEKICNKTHLVDKIFALILWENASVHTGVLIVL